jgi:hypothetical protein
LSIATLLVDSASLITSREHPNWVYCAKSNLKPWLYTRRFILTCRKFGDPSVLTNLRRLGLWKLFSDSFVQRFLVANDSSGLYCVMHQREGCALERHRPADWRWGQILCRGWVLIRFYIFVYLSHILRACCFSSFPISFLLLFSPPPPFSICMWSDREYLLCQALFLDFVSYKNPKRQCDR